MFSPPSEKNEPLLGSKPVHFPLLSSSLFITPQSSLDPPFFWSTTDIQSLTMSYHLFPVLHRSHLRVPVLQDPLRGVRPVRPWWPGQTSSPMQFLWYNFFRLFTIAFTVSFLKIFLLLNFFLNPQSHLVHCCGDRKLNKRWNTVSTPLLSWIVFENWK